MDVEGFMNGQVLHGVLQGPDPVGIITGLMNKLIVILIK